MHLICPTTQAARLRQNNTTGNLRMADMCELPVVPDLHQRVRGTPRGLFGSIGLAAHPSSVNS